MPFGREDVISLFNVPECPVPLIGKDLLYNLGGPYPIRYGPPKICPTERGK